MFANFKKPALILILLVVLSSCTSDRFEVDLDKVSLQTIPLKTLHKDIIQLNDKNLDEQTVKLKHQYGNFYERYITSFINGKGTTDSLYRINILHFINDKDIKNCNKEIETIYTADFLSNFEKESNDAIKRFHFFFPKRLTPKQITTCQSGWNYSTAFTDSTLVVGLDMYLGEKSIYYQMLNFQQYRTSCMNKNYILPDLMQGWLLTEFDNDVPTNTLLNHSIFYGKIFFTIKALVPEIEDSVILHYNKKQMAYCDAYEKNLWGFMAEKNRLYENNMRTVQELTGEGPFTSAISKECPPGIAKWIGWQIVKSYMKNNENVSLEELMNEKDAQKILNKSKYRP